MGRRPSTAVGNEEIVEMERQCRIRERAAEKIETDLLHFRTVIETMVSTDASSDEVLGHLRELVCPPRGPMPARVPVISASPRQSRPLATASPRQSRPLATNRTLTYDA